MSDCICDGAKYEEQRYPFLVHPDCPVHRPPADRDDLAAILAKHDDWINNQDGTAAICDCKAVISTSNSWTECDDAHRAHVAQMVLESDWLRGVKADVWERVCKWLDAHDESDVRSSVKRGARDTNPYRADRVDAEDGGR